MTTAREVLDLQADLAARLEDGDGDLSRYLDLVSRAQGLVGRRTGGISSTVFEHVLGGRAFRIAGAMGTEIEYRAWTSETHIPHSMKIAELAPPRHRGFAYLETPIRYTDMQGRLHPVSAFTWGYTMGTEGEKGYLITSWGDVTLPGIDRSDIPGLGLGEQITDLWTPEVHQEVFGRWIPIAAFWGPLDGVAGERTMDWTEDEIAQMRAEGVTDHGTTVVAAGRSILALWQLLRETVDTTSEHQVETVPTQGRKRVAGKHVRPEVNVIALRRPSRPTLRPGTGPKRTYRSWVEGGYTQTYWVGPGRKTPVTKTIGGHWSVSDDELPIRNRPTVYDLRR